MRSTQTMKPETAARKLGILLDAAPAEFREVGITREAFNALQLDPPQWLAELRRNGPHPRREVARKLGISNTGLARAGITDALTTTDIKALLAEMPAWLVDERERQAVVRAENKRLKARQADRVTGG